MANNRTITAANAILMIAVDKVFPIAQRISGFAADDISDADALEQAERSMGIDGRLSAGYVPVQTRQRITLQSDSTSIDFFELWVAYQTQQRELVIASGSLVLSAIQKTFTLNRGYLVTYPPLPSLKKTIQPRQYTIEWESVSPAPKF